MFLLRQQGRRLIDFHGDMGSAFHIVAEADPWFFLSLKKNASHRFAGCMLYSIPGSVP